MRKAPRRVRKPWPTNTDLQQAILENMKEIQTVQKTVQDVQVATRQNQEGIIHLEKRFDNLEKRFDRFEKQNESIIQTLDRFIVLQERNATEVVALYSSYQHLDKRVTRLETKIH